MDPLTPPPAPVPNGPRPTPPLPPAPQPSGQPSTPSVPRLSSTPPPPPKPAAQVPVPAPVATPVPVPAQVPPVASAPAAQRPLPVLSPLDDEDEIGVDKDLESLSPLSVMKKRTPNPVAPAPAPAPGNTASQVPSPQPFILPNQLPGSQPVPAAPAPKPVVPAPAPVAPAPAPVRPLPPVAPLPSASKAPVAPPTSTRSALPAASHKRTPIGLLAVAGLVVALVLLAGGGYVLALNGSRLPVLYKLASGLESDGLAVANQATSYLATRQSYQESGSIAINAGAVTGSSSLPDSAAGDSGVSGGISSVKVAVTSADPLMYDLKTGGLAGRLGLTLDTASELPIYLNTKATGLDSRWLFNLPANTVNPLVGVKSDDLRKNLLYPAFQPVSLQDVLSSVKKESEYQKVNGQSISRYSYELDTDKLASNLPVGATVTTATAEVFYRWKTAEPVETIVAITFNYQSRTYQLNETFDYGNWDAQLASATSDQSLAAVLNSENVSQALLVEAPAFVPQLGTTLSLIPNSYDITAVVAIVPSGEAVTEAGSIISTVPPLPVTPATEEAKKRDTQRLADMSDLQKALQAYKTKMGVYPKADALTQTRASADLIKALVPTYLTKMPVDPLTDTYWYEYISDGQTYILRSVAEDSSNSLAKLGKAYYYFEVTDSTK